MRISRLLALAFLASVAGCVSMGDGDEPIDSEQQAIIGGQEVGVGTYPAVVALTDGASLCTATLVHPEWVLTAAHCVTPSLTGYPDQADVTRSFFVIFDDVNVADADTSGQTVVGLVSSFLHPDWDPTNLGNNDVAVLHLATPITDRPPIPIHRAVVPSSTQVLQVGFGVSEGATKSGAGLLRQLQTQTSACSLYGYSDTNLLCFDANDGDGTCFGDSGGPTFVDGGGGKLEVAGLTSFGNSEVCTGMNASTHVASELSFIDQHIPKATPSSSPPGPDSTAIGPPPTIFGDCSIGAGRGHRDTSAAASAGVLVLVAFALLAFARRRARIRS